MFEIPNSPQHLRDPVSVVGQRVLTSLVGRQTFDVVDISNSSSAWPFSAWIFHREVLTAYAVVGVRLRHVPADSVSQRLLAGSFRRPHHAVDRAALLACRERRSGLVGP